MSNLALYRKYRPKNFDEISGQSAIVQTLRNQIRSGRIAHAYLFQGLRGSGKTSIARIFAKAVNCESTIDGNPCNQCEHCITKNDVNPDLIEIDAASNNGVDNIRQLIDEVNYKPTNSKYKVYIIDEVHMLSGSAFNALLKTIEEPPEHAIFILATTELNKVPPTIKSRCQIFNFKSLVIDEIKYTLKGILSKEQIDYFDDECLEFIAKKADGSMRDAVSILDQCISCHETAVDVSSKPSLVSMEELRQLFGDVDNEVIQELVECVKNSDILKGIDILHKQYHDGRNLKSILNGMYEYYFNQYATGFNTDDGIVFERYSRILGETMQTLDHSQQKLTVTEVAFIKLCKPEMEKDYNSVVQRMRNLEREIELLKSGKTVSMPENQVSQNIVDENAIIYYNSRCKSIITIQ